MKRIFIVFIMVVFMVVPALAEEKKAEPKYQVEITVVYNAVSIAEADRITANARRDHVDACKVEIVSKGVNGGAWVAVDVTDYTLYTTN